MFDEIRAFVNQHIGNTNIELDRETRLYEDLKIDADDAFELLDAFRTKFIVDMSGFDFNEYFAPEGIDLIGAFLSFFKKNKASLKDLTLGDLEQAAKAGRWIEKTH